MNTKGNIIIENVIFLILNLVFFGIMIAFISSNSYGRPVYEQAYAKQIALMIDEAKPEMTISLDMREVVDKYKRKVSDIVELDNEDRRITIRLGDRGGRSFDYFTDAKVSFEQQGKYNLIIKVEGKEV